MEKERGKLEAMGTVSVSLSVNCPKCDNFIWDQYDCEEEFQYAQEECGPFDASGDFTCPECKEEFHVSGFEY